MKTYIVVLGNLVIGAETEEEATKKAKKMVKEGWVEISGIMEE